MAVQNPQLIVDLIDNEGWPDALSWLNRDEFEDEQLSALITEASSINNDLQGVYNKLRDRCEELGVDWYIG